MTHSTTFRCSLFIALVACLLCTTAWANKSTKKPRLKPSEVAKNELIDKRFLKDYKGAIASLQAGKYGFALKQAQSALQKRPQSGRVLLVMASIYKRQKQYNNAIQYFQQAAQRLNGKKTIYEKAQALYNVAFCFEILGQRPNAIAAWQMYVSHTVAFHMRNNRVGFARKRITALQSVKGKPAP